MKHGLQFRSLNTLKTFQNEHSLNFEHIAKFWGLSYECWEEVPEAFGTTRSRLIEIVPDLNATNRFWQIHQSINLSFQILK